MTRFQKEGPQAPTLRVCGSSRPRTRSSTLGPMFQTGSETVFSGSPAQTPAQPHVPAFRRFQRTDYVR